MTDGQVNLLADGQAPVALRMGVCWRGDSSGPVPAPSRVPTADELFSNGPHLATSSFEIGDPTLDQEISVGLDVSLRKTEGKFHGEVTLFNNRFDELRLR